jgi:transposase
VSQHEQSRPEKIQEELIEITEELKTAQEQALAGERRRRQMMEGLREEGKNNFRDYDQSQVQFVPVRLDTFLEADHPARIIDLVVERLDLSSLYACYSEEGNPPYHPRMMLKVLFYAYYKGLMSCRQVWDALQFRADFIFLSAGQVPNFRTVNSFRLRHLEQLPQLFAQIVFMCVRLGMVGFEYLSVDGQKIQANASFRRSKNLKGLRKEYGKVQQAMERLVERPVEEQDFTAEVQQRRLERLENKARQLEGFQKKLEALGDEEKRLNMSDEDAPVMRHKNRRIVPSYNHQSAVDLKYGVVCAVQSTQNGDQPEDLLPVVDAAKENTGGEHEKVLADSGFCDYERLQEVEEERGEDFYLPDKRYEASKDRESEPATYPPERFERQADGGLRCPEGHPMAHKRTVSYEDGHQVHIYEGTACEGCPSHDRCTRGAKRTVHVDSREPFRDSMRAKLSSDAGREAYMKRQGASEPVHGDDQKNKGWTQHHLRGLPKARGEFLLIRIATNLGKIIRYRSPEILALA